MKTLLMAAVGVGLVTAACNGSVQTGDGGVGGGSGGGGSAGGAGGGGGGGGSVVVDAGPPIEPGDAGAAEVTFVIRSDQNVHPISPLVYGTNSVVNPTANKFSVVRLGGNRLSAFNWENNASNAGSDYMYQNDGHLSASNTPGAAVTDTLAKATALGAAALITVPIGDYVAADKSPGGDVRNSGANYLTTRFKKNKSDKGSALSTTPDTTDDSVYQDEFVNWVKTVAAPTAPQVLISLDNEPDLWADTHPEIHPAKVGYDELVNRTLEYGRMVKKVWPAVEVTGFVSYGYGGFINLQSAPDAAGKGDFIDYFLTKIKAAQDADGHRVVDYLDLHWYPEATGGGTRIITSQTSPAVVATRVQAPRSLWDPTYREPSWVANYVNGPIKLLPWLQAKIDAKAPGTKLAFTEWNYGGGGHISGTVAVADVLGIFGRDNVAMATYWPLNSDETFAYVGIRVFRNFDGAGGTFGDTSISATSSSAELASVYASIDSGDVNRVVIVAINKATKTTNAAMTVAHPKSFSKLKVYTVTATGGANIVAGADVSAVAANAFNYAMPAMSVSVLVPTP